MVNRAAWMLVLLLGCGAAGSTTPIGVVQRFYAELRASRVSGAPDEAQLARLAPYLSDSLQELLVEARRAHDADVARAPDAKPSFAEGDLFSSLFEGPTRVAPAADFADGPVRRVPVRMTYDSATPPASWADTVILSSEGGRWVIDDIRYGGAWDFALRGTLRSQLSGGAQ